MGIINRAKIGLVNTTKRNKITAWSYVKQTQLMKKIKGQINIDRMSIPQFQWWKSFLRKDHPVYRKHKQIV